MTYILNVLKHTQPKVLRRYYTKHINSNAVVIRTEGSKFFLAIKKQYKRAVIKYAIVNRIYAESTFEVVDKFKDYNSACTNLGIVYKMTYELNNNGDYYFLFNDDQYASGDKISAEYGIVKEEYKYGIEEVEVDAKLLVTGDNEEENTRHWLQLFNETVKSGEGEDEEAIHDRLMDELEAIRERHIRDMFSGDDSDTKDWKIVYNHATVDIVINGEEFAIEKSGTLFQDLRRFEQLYLRYPKFLQAVKANFKWNQYNIWGIRHEADEFFFHCKYYDFWINKDSGRAMLEYNMGHSGYHVLEGSWDYLELKDEK